MKKLLALACISVLMLAPACCRRGPCGEPCGVEEECNPLDTFNGSEQCVTLCPPEMDCRETCPPVVKCEVEEVPVKLFRKRKTCVATMVGPVEATCETDIVKCPDIQATSEGMEGVASVEDRKAVKARTRRGRQAPYAAAGKRRAAPAPAKASNYVMGEEEGAMGMK